MKPKPIDVPGMDCWLHVEQLGRSEQSLCVHHAVVEAGLPTLAELQGLLAGRLEHCAFRLPTVHRQRAITKLTVRVRAADDSLQVMSIRCEVPAATIDVTHEGLVLLIDAFNTWFAGGEDFGVSPSHSGKKPKQLGNLDRESIELWFWGPSYHAP